MDQEIAAKFDLRNRVMQRMYRALPPEERIELADRVVREAMAELRANPVAFERAYRRNLQQRAISRDYADHPTA